MSKVVIHNPQSGEEREVTRSVLGPMRRKGWVIGSKPEVALQDVGQSKKEEVLSEESLDFDFNKEA